MGNVGNRMRQLRDVVSDAVGTSDSGAGTKGSYRQVDDGANSAADTVEGSSSADGAGAPPLDQGPKSSQATQKAEQNQPEQTHSQPKQESKQAQSTIEKEVG